jgi:hypothetical protein
VGIPFFIQDNGIAAIYPPEFAIVNNNDVTLSASTANALSEESRFVMELDISENFDSPFLKREESVQKGGLFKWQPQVNWENEQVYYWRVSPDSVSVEQGYVWDTRSFVYLTDYEEGWSQSDYGQYIKNDLGAMQFDTVSEELLFDNDFRDIRIKNKVYISAQDRPDYFNQGINWFAMWIWEVSSFNAGITIVVLEPYSTNYWINNEPGDYGSLNNVGAIPSYSFKTETIEDREKIINFLENIVPENHTVMVYSAQRNFDEPYFSPEWALDSVSLGKNIFSVLESQGANKIRNLETLGSVPYVLMYEKGRGVVKEKIANDINDEISVEHGFPKYLTEGNFFTSIIGPSTEWKNFYWNKSVDNLESDTAFVSIYGISDLISGAEVELLPRVEAGDTTLAFIDADLYPYLKLKYNGRDTENLTPAQINYWRVTYKGITELAVNPNAAFEFYRDTLQEGEIFKVRYAIENISDYNADSLLIRYSVVDENNEAFVQNDRVAPLEKFGETVEEFSMDTKGLSNIQRVLVEINPDDDQMEVTHVNNFITSDFFVERDQRNPILDVTFDGVYIMDGDLVSPQPKIVINLKDENQYLAISDTSLFKLSLQYPDESTARSISFDDEPVLFFPAILNGDEDKNEARIEFSPILSIDGIYSLIVEGKDATGNQSGDLKYTIQFEVINKNMISNIVNYPNPFSTSTRFVYTLTGNEPPTFFKIQIMTVSGRIIREITQDEIGPLRTGTHTTDYAWDGTDEFGDRLANGVYLYRVSAQKNDGTEFEQIETGADKFVQKGFGKMVLVR